MKKDFTKGKWKIHRYSNTDIRIIDKNKMDIAILDLFVNGLTPKENKANAKLIACAPELLEALMELVELKQLKFNDGEYPSEEYAKRKPIAWDNAKKVLEKALS